MSVILDALRKSEAERQRGRAPGLFVEQVAPPSRRRRRPAWIFVLPALLAAGIVASWFLRPQTNGPTVAAVPLNAPPADTAVPAPELPTTAAALPARPVPANQEALVPPPQLLPPEPTAPAQGSAAPAPVAPVAAPAPEPVPAPIASTPPAPAAPPDPVPMEATALPVEPLLPRLADLPAAERATLPPLKLSMHVFADEPAQRFVILDGRRQGEGASPAAGVVIEQIRRDGVVLSANGRRLLLPRP